MTRSIKNSVLDRGTRQRGARAVAGSWLHGHYAAMLAEPLPAEIKDLVAQLVGFEASTEKSRERSLEVSQFASAAPGRRW
jgi:hypothetical protein